MFFMSNIFNLIIPFMRNAFNFRDHECWHRENIIYMKEIQEQTYRKHRMDLAQLQGFPSPGIPHY